MGLGGSIAITWDSSCGISGKISVELIDKNVSIGINTNFKGGAIMTARSFKKQIMSKLMSVKTKVKKVLVSFAIASSLVVAPLTR